jgi:hypothetical protein
MSNDDIDVDKATRPQLLSWLTLHEVVVPEKLQNKPFYQQLVKKTLQERKEKTKKSPQTTSATTATTTRVTLDIVISVAFIG